MPEPARDGRLDAHTRSVEVDLLVARYFGLPIVLAVYEAEQPVGRPVILRVPAAAQGHAGLRMPVPFLNFRQDGWQ